MLPASVDSSFCPPGPRRHQRGLPLPGARDPLPPKLPELPLNPRWSAPPPHVRRQWWPGPGWGPGSDFWPAGQFCAFGRGKGPVGTACWRRVAQRPHLSQPLRPLCPVPWPPSCGLPAGPASSRSPPARRRTAAGRGSEARGPTLLACGTPASAARPLRGLAAVNPLCLCLRAAQTLAPAGARRAGSTAAGPAAVSLCRPPVQAN